MAAARAAGATEPTHVVAVGDQGRGVKSPCGKDRQIFADLYPRMRVIVDSPDGLVCVLACELLPSGYDYLAGQH